METTGKETAWVRGCYSFTIQRDVAMPMRDGVLLAGDLYLPDATGSVPAICERTPYNKYEGPIHWTQSPEYFASRGFAVVIQDVRGRHNSEGEFYPSRSDAWGEMQDGFDTVEWIASQAWCSGRVGMFGGSYGGALQLLAAASRPPHLAALVARQYFLSPRDFVFRGGVLEAGQMSGWLVDQARRSLAHRDGQLQQLQAAAFEELVENFERLLLTNPLEWISDWLTHDAESSYWDEFDVRRRVSAISVPILHVAGWYDMLLDSTLTGFRLCSSVAEAADSQRLVIGPWLHTSRFNTEEWGRFVGSLDMGEEARVDLNDVMLQWFEQWLVDSEASVQQERSRVKYFVIGSNVWRRSSGWPPTDSQTLQLFLAHEATLRDERPTVGETVQLLDDPTNPAPTVGGNAMFFSYPPGHDGAVDLSPSQRGPRDQRSVEAFGAVFTSGPLSHGLEIAGKVRAELWVTPDYDGAFVVARLSVVSADGKSLGVSEGAAALGREAKDQRVRVEIGMNDIAISIAPEERLRLYVGTSDYPRFGRRKSDTVGIVRLEVGGATSSALFVDVRDPDGVRGEGC